MFVEVAQGFLLGLVFVVVFTVVAIPFMFGLVIVELCRCAWYAWAWKFLSVSLWESALAPVRFSRTFSTSTRIIKKSNSLRARKNVSYRMKALT